MQFELFERLCRDSWDDWKHPANLERALHPRSRKLRAIMEGIPGMASENKLMLLNNAIACLEHDEVYVEVGCWQGLTLVGAMTGNDSQKAFACDNFSQFGGPKNALAQNLSKYLPKETVRFFDMDYREFFAAAPWLPRRIGVYFYDGGHRFAEQYHAIELALPYLADQALIVVDDTNNPAVRRANHWLVHRLRFLQPIPRLLNPWKWPPCRAKPILGFVFPVASL